MRRGAVARSSAAPLLAIMLAPFVRSALYPAPPVRVPSPPPVPLVEVVLPLAAEGEVVAWLRRAPGERATPPPLVLFFHGNGENLETLRLSGLFDELAALDVDVLAVDYPGYGRSPGSPSEATLAASADAAWRWARATGTRKIVACGWSLGAAVAIPLAVRHPDLAGLVAISPWTSLNELAALYYPAWLTQAALGAHRYDSLAAAPNVRVPALVVHGANDAIIPAAHGQRLAAAIPDARWVPVAGAGHNDLLARREVWRQLGTFIRGLAPR